MRNRRGGGLSFPTVSDWFDHQLLRAMVKCRACADWPSFLDAPAPQPRSITPRRSSALDPIQPLVCVGWAKDENHIRFFFQKVKKEM